MLTDEQKKHQEHTMLELFAYYGYSKPQFTHKPIICEENYKLAIQLLMKGKHHGTHK